MLKVFLHPEANKEIKKIPKAYRSRILERLGELEKLSHPLQHPKIIKLSGAENNFRLRVGDYRIKFTLRDSDTVLITHIQHRQVGY